MLQLVHNSKLEQNPFQNTQDAKPEHIHQTNILAYFFCILHTKRGEYIGLRIYFVTNNHTSMSS